MSEKQKRTVKNGRVTIRGRVYHVPHFQRLELEGERVYVDTEGVMSEDLPKFGIRTAWSVRCYFPRFYDYFATLHLDQKFADGLRQDKKKRK